MKTKHDDIIKGWNKIEGKNFLVRVSSLATVSPLGADYIEAITIFDQENLRIVEIDLLWITHNFGDWDRYEFAEKYPEHII